MLTVVQNRNEWRAIFHSVVGLPAKIGGRRTLWTFWFGFQLFRSIFMSEGWRRIKLDPISSLWQVVPRILLLRLLTNVVQPWCPCFRWLKDNFLYPLSHFQHPLKTQHMQKRSHGVFNGCWNCDNECKKQEYLYTFDTPTLANVY